MKLYQYPVLQTVPSPADILLPARSTSPRHCLSDTPYIRQSTVMARYRFFLFLPVTIYAFPSLAKKQPASGSPVPTVSNICK